MAFFSRGPNKIHEPHTLQDSYDYYIIDKEEDTPYYVSFKEYKEIICEYNKYICELVLEGKIFYMPFGMGSLFVNKRPIKVWGILSPDWESTLKYGKMVRHLNEHSNGFRYSFKWDKEICRFKNHRSYRLVMTRENKRSLAKFIKQKGYDYIEN